MVVVVELLGLSPANQSRAANNESSERMLGKGGDARKDYVFDCSITNVVVVLDLWLLMLTMADVTGNAFSQNRLSSLKVV